MINYSKQNITKKDISSVIRSLKEEFITTGPATELFEKNFRNKVRSKFAVSCSSGTAALQLALNSMNIKKSYGGTSEINVKSMIKKYKKEIK